jgi:hypothetical protein
VPSKKNNKWRRRRRRRMRMRWKATRGQRNTTPHIYFPVNHPATIN